MSRSVSRRDFVKSIGLAGAGYWAATSSIARAFPASEKLNIAIIGLGRQGCANLRSILDQNIVAVCDADEGFMMKKVEGMSKKYPTAEKVVSNAKFFNDFRVMFDKMQKEIDAVLIATPDHVHFHPAWWALERDKHLYLEKPMAHNVWEVRQLTNLARQRKLATQMGVQRHSFNGLRDGVELVRSGVLGTIKEVYSWTDSARGGNYPFDDKEAPTDKLNWDMWLGPTDKIPYRDGLAHYHFRFWWKYGTGEAGNLGCHVLDIPYWALDLKYPTSVTATGPKPDLERTPTAMQTIFEFPANDTRPGVKLHWDQGIPQKFHDVIKEHKLELSKKEMSQFNNMFIGEKGILLTSYYESPIIRLLPADKFEGVKAARKMFPTTGTFHQEWIDACKGGAPATCNFDYSGPMTETVLLANVAYRLQTGFNWNAEKMEADNAAVAQYLKEPYRKGWEI